MGDSADQFTDALVTRPAAADRPVNDVSAGGFATGAADAARQAAANGETRILGADQDHTSTGITDATSESATLRSGIANAPAVGPTST